MPLFHQFDDITNGKTGAGLPNFQVSLRDPITNAIVPIFGDASGTPIISTSGIVNTCITDSVGNYSLYVAYGTYNVVIADEGGNPFTTILNVPMFVGAPGDKGDPGPQGNPGGGPGGSVGPFSALGGIIVPAGVSTFLVDDGGFVVYDPTITNADLAAYPQAMSKDQMGRPFRRDVSNGVSALGFGGIADYGTNATDNLPALNAAYAYLKRMGVGTGYYRGGARLHVPVGQYFVSGTFEMKGLTCILEGDGSGMAGGAASMLVSPKDTCAIRVHRYNTIGAGVETNPTQGSDGTIIRNMMLQGAKTAGTPNTSLSGLWARCRVKISDVVVDGFAGAGILIRAQQGGGGSIEGNANNWRIDTVRLTNNGADGLVVQGADANAGLSHGVDASNNIGYGIRDESFLGNRHAGFQMEANTLGPWITTNDNAFCWMDGYTEPGQPNAKAAGNTIYSGPQFVGVTGGVGLRAQGLAGGGLGASTGFNAMRTRPSDGKILQHLMGPDATNSEYDRWTAPAGGTFSLADSSEDLIWLIAGIFEGYRLKSGFTAETFGRPSNATTRGVIQFRKGIWLGDGTNARNMNYVHAKDAATAATALNGQEVALGDRFLFDQPTPGGAEGVTVTTAGVVGGAAVLKAFGSISA